MARFDALAIAMVLCVVWLVLETLTLDSPVAWAGTCPPPASRGH